jgi:hypothetical protein
MERNIALYKTYEQLLLEKFKVGDVYTYNSESFIQIVGIKNVYSTHVIQYRIKRREHVSTNTDELYITAFMMFLKAPPTSIYVRNEPLWE